MYPYSPYNPYQHLFPQNMTQQTGQFMQGAQTQATQHQPDINVVQVSTIKQVEQAPVAPGSRVLVLVSNEPVIAMRSADNMGIASTDYYKIEKIDPSATAAKENDYVTRQEFQKFVESLSAAQNAPEAKEGKTK